ncbi:MAG: YggS family pyridoxal phosphate-dependent enzyme [Paludibacteraceae bacterium]|nr:YggS family pyridoxal phosphate-dependent enzyme [Paludibacteraceae bacterium]
MTIANTIQQIRNELPPQVTLICVSKYQSEDAIMEAYNAGERDFGESHVQELCRKYEHLPKDIRWHMIGHLQTNKVKYIVPFVHLIQSVDSWKLLKTINKEAGKIGRRIAVLLEVHTAQEESKSGMTIDEAVELLRRLTMHGTQCTIEELPWIDIKGLMTMATNTDDEQEIRRCFRQLHSLNSKLYSLNSIFSMGMSDDYRLAVGEGSTMVRIGSKIFGNREQGTGNR